MHNSGTVRDPIEPSTVVQGLVQVNTNACLFNISHKAYIANSSPLFRQSVMVLTQLSRLVPCIFNKTWAFHSYRVVFSAKKVNMSNLV